MTKIPIQLTSNHLLYLTDLLSKGTLPVNVMKRTTAFPGLNQDEIFAVPACRYQNRRISTLASIVNASGGMGYRTQSAFGQKVPGSGLA